MSRMKEMKTFLAQMATLTERNGQKNSIQGYVLRKGTEEANQEDFTAKEKAQIKELFYGLDCEMKQCYYTNQLALTRHAYRDHGFQYTEGFVAAAIIPVMHAYLTLNGKVVDVTLRNHDDYNEDMMTRVVENRKRYAYLGVAFKNSVVVKKLIDIGESFSVIDNWKDRHPVLTGKEADWVA